MHTHKLKGGYLATHERKKREIDPGIPDA
jgi:hypothetical protein